MLTEFVAGVAGPWDWQHAPAPSLEQVGPRELQNNNKPTFGDSGGTCYGANNSAIEFL